MIELPEVGFDRRVYLATLPTLHLIDNVGSLAPILNRFMQTLIMFRTLTLGARHEWVAAISATSVANSYTSRRHRSFRDLIGNPNKDDAHKNNLIAACQRLWMQERAAFGDSVDEKAVNSAERIAAYPWCLCDSEFELCNIQVERGQLPKLEPGRATDWVESAVTWGHVLLVGAGLVFSSAIPEAVGPGFVVVGAANWLADREEKAVVFARYNLDVQRRRLLKPT